MFSDLKVEIYYFQRILNNELEGINPESDDFTDGNNCLISLPVFGNLKLQLSVDREEHLLFPGENNWFIGDDNFSL